MEKQKKMIYYIVEILYLLTIFCFMLLIKNGFSVSSTYDFNVFLSIALFVIGILWFIGPKLNRIFGFVILVIYTLYFVAQNVYYRAFAQYFRFSTALGLKNEVAGVSSEIKELLKTSDFIPFAVFGFITLLFVLMYIVLQRKVKIKFPFRLLGLLSICISISMLLMTVNKINETKETVTNFDVYKSDYYVYDVIPNTNQFVDKFGLNLLLIRDAQLTLASKTINEDDYKFVDDYFTNNAYIHSDNEMTGIFKGKSLLVIQAESLMNLAISEEFTPNMYYFINSGIFVKNFNTPLLVGSTSDTEFMANTSMMPITQGYPVCYDYVKNTYPITLGNVFKDNGYVTYGYHNNYAEYYNRDVVFDKFGYEFFDSSKLGLENLEPDTKLADTIGWILSEKDNYMGYWVSYSGHQTYELDSVGVNKEDVAKIKTKYPDLDDSYVSYIAKAMDFDKALGNFINVMDWSGRLNDFVIVVYGDHVAKGLDFSKGSNYDEVIGKNAEDNPDIIYTPMFIYSVGGTHRVINKYSTSLDILPTLANMWNLDVDYAKTFGKDIFDENYDGFYFDEEGNYKTNNFTYNVISDELIIDDNYSKDDALQEVSKFNLMKDVCSKILKLNYFEER